MSKYIENKAVEIMEFPKTNDQDMSLIFYFESPKEEAAQSWLEHQASWISEELKKYPMPEREVLYNKVIERIRERDKNMIVNN